MKQRFLIAILVTSILLSFPTKVSAEGIVFGIKPENPQISYYQFTLAPGESVDDVLIASNQSNQTIKLKIAPVDGFTATGGGIAYDYKRATGTSTWVSIPDASLVTLKAQHIKRLPFSVSVPPGTPPGEYVAGFLSALDDSQTNPEVVSESNGTSISVDVIAQVAVAIIIRVPGPEKCSPKVESLTTELIGGQWKLSLNLVNEGNVHFSGNGHLTAINPVNKSKTMDLPVQLGYFVPGTSLTYYTFQPLPPSGAYDISFMVTDKDDPFCKMSYTETVEVKTVDQEQLKVQATEMSGFMVTPIPAKPADQPNPSSPLAQVQTPGTPFWFMWVSGIVLLLGIGLTLYALSILKKSKK